MEEVDPPDAIPDSVFRYTFACEQTLDADHLMLHGRTPADFRIPQLWIEKDAALSLTDGVVGQHDEAVLDQTNRETLVKYTCFAGQAMPNRL